MDGFRYELTTGTVTRCRKSWKGENDRQTTYKLTTNTVTYDYLKLRGDIVHRSTPDTATSHPVKKVDLEKTISFLKLLVDATERVFGPV